MDGVPVKRTAKGWLALGVLTLLSPLGLILPACFKAGGAWGEWGPEEFQKMIGYVPQGLSKMEHLWKAPMPDYTFKGWGNKGLTHLSLAYVVSAVAGVALVVGAAWLVGKALAKKDD